jgi:hypothetical protein
MEIFFQLWDTASGNLVTEFGSEDAAIDALRGVQSEDGDAPFLDLALVRYEEDRPFLVAKGRDLVTYVAHARTRGRLQDVVGGTPSMSVDRDRW